MSVAITSTSAPAHTYQAPASAANKTQKPAEQQPDTVSISSKALGKGGDADGDGR